MVTRLKTNSPCYQIPKISRCGRRSSGNMSRKTLRRTFQIRSLGPVSQPSCKSSVRMIYTTFYLELFEVVGVVATLPVTVASCERTHSKIKIINNYLRASMSDERLESLIQIAVEKDLADKIELGSLVDVFKTVKNRKLPL